MENLKTFNLIKRAIWSCVLIGVECKDRTGKQVDLVLLRDLMLELKEQLDFYNLVKFFEK